MVLISFPWRPAAALTATRHPHASSPVLPGFCRCSSTHCFSPAHAGPRRSQAPDRLCLGGAKKREPPILKIYFYEHDGSASGKLVGSIDSPGMGVNKTRSDMHPTLSRDGRYCAFSAQFGITDGARIDIYDRQEKKLLDLPNIHGLPKVHEMAPSFSRRQAVRFHRLAAGRRLAPGAFCSMTRQPKSWLDLPALNSENSDQRMPALSGDGRFLAYASNARGGVGLTDIYLYDLTAKKVIAVPEINSRSMDIQPALSDDGRLVAFASDRPGGTGGADIYSL